MLHHTPDIKRALKEINRVLRPSGEIILMLYTKESFNYWVRIQILFRIRFLFELLKDRCGITLFYPWKNHIENYRTIGHPYFSWRNFPHRCIDGPGCEIANTYYRSDVTNLLNSSGFTTRRTEKVHFPMGGKHPGLERRIAKHIGFYLFVWANKRQLK